MKRKIIIDTDPGVDDILAILLALSSPELEVIAITTVHGNIDLFNTTRNVLSLFGVLHASLDKMSDNWLNRLFTGSEVILAAGERDPLNKDRAVNASYFHGADGLGGISEKYSQFVPETGWERSFPALNPAASGEPTTSTPGISVSSLVASDEILNLLSSHDPDEITIVALGPLTNLSRSCTKDYATFSRVKEVVVMGGAMECPGNATPLAEFNFLADPESCAHVMSFTGPDPSSTYNHGKDLGIFQRLRITVLPLDTTTHVCISYEDWSTMIESSPLESGHNEPRLIEWCDYFMQRTFKTLHDLYTDTNIERVNLSAHDPSCIWYLLCHEGVQLDGKWILATNEDVRVECDGRWTRGACVLDQRGRQKIAEGEDVAGRDQDSWLSTSKGNRVSWVRQTSGSAAFVRLFGERVFGSFLV